MKKVLYSTTFIIALFLSIVFSNCEVMAQSGSYDMNITINGRTMTATMVDNSSTKALKEILEQGDITFSANDYGNFEKVGALGHTLPENNEQINTVPGDIILYLGNAMCLYYGQNSWNFTRLGKINFTSETELKEFLKAGSGSISVTLSLGQSSIQNVEGNREKPSKIYSLDGRAVSEQKAKNGIFVVDGKLEKR